MFINISNHPSNKWGEKQILAAKQYGGKVVDIAFPAVPATATSTDVDVMARNITERVIDAIASEAVINDDIGSIVVMAQGEFTLTYAIIRHLKGIATPVAACSDRKVVETINEKGETEKSVIFDFVQFRPY